MSTKWNDDAYTRKARDKNFLARSVFKLEEITQREQILRGVTSVLDLGASPGSWSQFVVQKAPNAQVTAVDIAPLRFKHARLKFFEMPIQDFLEQLKSDPKQFDLVLSDMAPKTSGLHDRDVLLSFELANLALETARCTLKEGGTFVAKLFMGATFEEYEKSLQTCFSTVRRLRPESTRKHSREIYFIAKGFRRG